jgi:glycosyltransferase involved in cell wall biosynthesis
MGLLNASTSAARAYSAQDEPLRVLLISHTCRSAAMGQPKARLLGQLPGIQLRVLVPDRWRNDDGGRTPVDQPIDDSFQLEIGKVRWPFTRLFKRYYHHYPMLRKTLEDFQPHVIDIWEEPWGLVSAQVCSLRRRMLPSAKIISETEQNLDRWYPPPFQAIRRYVLRRADFVIARSSEALTLAHKKGFTGPGEVVPNAVDAELFHPMDRAACRKKLGVHGFVVGYVGRMVEEKGIQDLLDALPLCPPDSQVNVLLVGGGDYLPALKEQAQRLNLGSRITFLAGRPLNQLPELFNAMDVLALPSRTVPKWKEQFGRVIIEAHACAIPVIGSLSGAIPEVIGGGGLTFAERNPKALAATILRLAADPALGVRMGAVGRQQVEEHYTWQRVAEQMYNIYHRLAPAVAGKKD